jgi:hypothetical protein
VLAGMVRSLLAKIDGKEVAGCVDTARRWLLDHECGKAFSNLLTDADKASVDEIFRLYPRKRDIGAAREAIRAALKDTEIPCPKNQRAAFLINAVKTYAAFVESKKTDQYMIPYPATWFRRKSYLNGVVK